MAKITVASFSNETEAHLALGRLQLDGIKGLVNRFSRYRAMGAGGYQLKVECTDAAAAGRILGGMDQEIDMDEYVDADDTSYDRCPRCNSVNVEAAPRSPKLIVPSLLLLGLPLLFISRDYSCNKCGHTWRK